MPLIPFGEWLPDQPTLHAGGATEASGVIPRTAKSYGPVPGFSAFSTTPLAARCQGAFAARDKSGNIINFAGDVSKLYKLSSAAWSDVSKPATTYAVATDGNWRFAQFGNYVIACDFVDNNQSYELTSSATFDNLSTTSPKARYVAQIRSHLMLANVNDSTDGLKPSRAHWSEIGNPTSWPTAGTSDAAGKQSGFSADLPGGWIQGLTGGVGGAEGALWTEGALFRVRYTGQGDVFAFDQVENARGCVAPNSIVNVGPFAIYLAEDGWYRFNGTESVPIGAQRVDKWFFGMLDQTYFHRITVAADPLNKAVFISFPSTSATSGTPDSILIYNWEANRWSHASVTLELIYKSATAGTDLDHLDALGYNLDTLPFSLDSRVWTGGRPLLAGFNTSHNSGYFNGSNLAAVLETEEFDADGRMIFVSGFRPVVDGGTVTGATKYRDTQSGSTTTATAVAVANDGVCKLRSRGRYMRAQVNIAAAGTWTHAQGIEPVIVPTGRR